MPKMHHRSVVLIIALAAGASALVLAQEPPAIDLEASRFDRAIAIDWSAAPETADSLFGGYKIWRSITPDPDAFLLLRHYERRYPVSWTYTTGTRRAFRDPDSIVQYRKVQVLNDSVIVRDYVGAPPFNGFPYFYAVTWVSECLSAQNDTVVVDQPQPQAEPFQREGLESFYFIANGDTLDVTRVPCRPIDPRTNQPVGDTTLAFVYRGTVESEEPLRHYAIESTRLREPISPSSSPKSNLSRVAVVPNPYLSSAPWDRPGERKMQFVNLTPEATVRIFTLGADLVRVLDHPAAGTEAGQGSVDWDLKNGEGKLVESGIYIYQVETPGGVADFQGRLVIVR